MGSEYIEQRGAPATGPCAKHALVIEDFPVIAMSIEDELAEMGYSAAVAATEAEAVALLCCAALDLQGVQEARGYIQNWWGAGNPIPERSAQRILKVADQILKAGTREMEPPNTVR